MRWQGQVHESIWHNGKMRVMSKKENDFWKCG